MAQIVQTSIKDQTKPTRTQTDRRYQSQKYVFTLLRHLVLIIVSIAFMFPFYWMLITALKENTKVFTYPLEWLPHPARWDNFSTAVNYPGFPFWRYLWNSTYYAVSVTVGTVLSCAAVGYGFARLRFPGRDF